MAHVLVVEDENIVALDIAQTLIAGGHTVPTTAATGEDAIRSVAEARPDIILMDIRLRGEMDGIETALRIRNVADVPVIFLTANADVDTIVRAKLVQPFGYVVKPFNDRELRSAIEVALYRHAIDRQLRDRERWFSTTLRSIADGVIATDCELRVGFLNPVAERLTGWSAPEALGRPVSQVCPLRDERTRERVDVSAGAGGRGPASALLERHDATELPIEHAVASIIAEDGVPLGIVVVLRDVSERRKLEERLSVSGRLASLGTMIAGAAHEINNPLTYNLANLSFARRTVADLAEKVKALDGGAALAPAFEDLAEALREAGEGGERVKHLVHDLKSFARPQTGAHELVDLGAVVETAVRLAWNEIRHRARFDKLVSPVPPVFGSARQLEQVVTNLLVNAAQAIQGSVDDNRIRLTLAPEGDHVVLEIEDTGVGIPADVLGRVFDPFFTTKPVGSGTGLGLSISHSIVSAHGGELTATSDAGKGSTFRLRLPPGRPPPAPGLAPSSALRGRVLVVDDEPSVARSVARALGGAYQVTIAASAEEALALLEGDARFDVVISDLMMPGMSGMELYERVEQASPARAGSFLFFTGGAFTERSRAFVERMPGRVIEKPFDVDRLAALVVERMRAAPGR
jgi:PAS domain S-box-containing protein